MSFIFVYILIHPKLIKIGGRHLVVFSYIELTIFRSAKQKYYDAMINENIYLSVLIVLAISLSVIVLRRR